MFVNHCHVGPQGNPIALRAGDPRFATLARLEEILAAINVEGAVVFPLYDHRSMMPSDCGPLNEWLAEELTRRPNLVGFATLDPKQEDSSTLAADLARRGFKGVKYHPPVFRTPLCDARNEPFYAVCEDLGLTLLIHASVHVSTPWPLRHYRPILIDEVAMRHPRLKIIVEHMGGFEFMHEALAVVRNNARCYAGLTALSTVPREILRHVLNTKCAGSPPDGSPRRARLKDKLIFGLDFPNREPDTVACFCEDLEIADTLGLSQEELACVFGGNLQRLLGER